MRLLSTSSDLNTGEINLSYFDQLTSRCQNIQTYKSRPESSAQKPKVKFKFGTQDVLSCPINFNDILCFMTVISLTQGLSISTASLVLHLDLDPDPGHRSVFSFCKMKVI